MGASDEGGGATSGRKAVRTVEAHVVREHELADYITVFAIKDPRFK